MKVGIAAVFGPISKIPRGHVQSICQAFDIPHLQAQWDSRYQRDDFSISVYPDYVRLCEAYADLIKEWGWKRYTIIYEDNDSKYFQSLTALLVYRVLTTIKIQSFGNILENAGYYVVFFFTFKQEIH